VNELETGKCYGRFLICLVLLNSEFISRTTVDKGNITQ